MIDSYLTITDPAEGEYSEKRSKFLAFAFHVETADEVKTIVSQYEKRYYDARHVCYAYMLGHLREEYRAVDNGEPSGTAGKPILGQINSNELTNILVIVVRYFGGIKLGTSGLIAAYKEATAECLRNANVEERTVDGQLVVEYEYPLMNQVMRVVKEADATILEQDFQISCRLVLSTRLSSLYDLRERMEQIYGVTIKD